MGKIKKEKIVKEENLNDSQLSNGIKEENSYEEQLRHVSVIAKPMATEKCCRRIYKMMKKASQHQTYMRRGLKDVRRQIMKGEKGIVVFAGNISPIEMMCHLPAVCEDKELPYVYTPSQKDLGLATGSNSNLMVVLIREHSDYQDTYNKVIEDINKIPKAF